MKQYDVIITEVSQKTITVEAASRHEAEQMIQDGWNNADYVLGAEDLQDMVKISLRELCRLKQNQSSLTERACSWQKGGDNQCRKR